MYIQEIVHDILMCSILISIIYIDIWYKEIVTGTYYVNVKVCETLFQYLYAWVGWLVEQVCPF